MKSNFHYSVIRVVILLAVLFSISSLRARPVPLAHKSNAATLTYLQQTNTLSNVEFNYDDRGGLFHGLYWPRGSGNGYVFGEGLWFATKKILANSAEAKEGWSLAGAVPGEGEREEVNRFFANSLSRQIFVTTNDDTSVFVFQDTDIVFKALTTFPPDVSTFTQIPNGNFLVGTSKGLFVGPETGPWFATIITSPVRAISSFGVISAGAAPGLQTIYTPNSDGSSWILRHAIGEVYFLSSLPDNESILAASRITVMLSKDTGNTWDTIPLPDTTITGGAIASNGNIVIATENGVFQSSNYGLSWVPQNEGLTDLNIRFIRSDDGVNFVLASDSGVFTNMFQNGTLGIWALRNAGVNWQGAVVAAAIDQAGFLHVATDSDGEIYTQWRSKTLIPGLKLFCDVGYNPNSGTGWYTEGEASQVGLTTTTDGADPNAKYISYVSPRYDAASGQYIPGSSTVVPSPYYNWPLWDTSTTNSLNHNFYFGDYVSDVNMRNTASINAQNPQLGIIGKIPAPAIVSQEDILNLYTDADSANDPEFVPGTGYPLGIDVQEEIYTWGYGSYRDMVFVRYKVRNSSNDTMYDSWIAPAFDPDLDAAVGGAANDANSYVDDSLVNSTADSTMVSQLSEPYRSDPSLLNMAVQWRDYNDPPGGKQYGWFGVSFVESPIVDSNGYIIPNDDSSELHGYGPNSLFQKNQEGLVGCRDWIILNDPSTTDLRYNFVANGEKDTWDGVYQDQRLLISTGPFNLLPGQSAEATIVLTLADVSDASYKQNFGALLLLAELEHQVFSQLDSTTGSVNNFQVTPQSSVNPSSTIRGLTMEQLYPNPFSTNCTISYQNSIAGAGSEIVTDVLGRTIQSISLGEVSAGQHTITLDGTDLPAGDYHIMLIVGSETTSQMVVRIP